MPWMPYSERQARDRAADELRKNPVRSDAVIAAAAGVGSSTVALARHALEQMYQIGRVPLSEREARPRPGQPSRARDLIQAHPGWSLQRVAAAAGVSVQSAWKMSRKTPQLGDLAAVTDSISVIRIIPVPCPRCGEPFLPDDRRRYCSPSCKTAADARRHALADALRGMDRPAHPPSVHAHPPPVVPALPPAPDWSRGRCTTVSPDRRTWWTSDDPDEKQAARSMCTTCPVRPECEQWSLALPLSDPSIYGGMSHAERQKRRRAWLHEIMRQVKTGRLPWVRVPGVFFRVFLRSGSVQIRRCASGRRVERRAPVPQPRQPEPAGLWTKGP
jgi:WhiB family redox-sensing transcriptional regulator